VGLEYFTPGVFLIKISVHNASGSLSLPRIAARYTPSYDHPRLHQTAHALELGALMLDSGPAKCGCSAPLKCGYLLTPASKYAARAPHGENFTRRPLRRVAPTKRRGGKFAVI
jgi:hypothetical protein